ncbi:MAG: hypothetical protein ABIK73_07455 [candidate division WOR-3 bacterium]
MKYVKVNGGQLVEEIAIHQSSGSSDGNKIVRTRSDGFLDPTFFPPGIGPQSIVVVAGESLSAGNLVYIGSDGKAYKADASGANQSKIAIGFVTSSFAANDDATVYTEGVISGLSGLTPGGRYFLTATPGTFSSTAPTTAGHAWQPVGYAINATTFLFRPDSPVTLS